MKTFAENYNDGLNGMVKFDLNKAFDAFSSAIEIKPNDAVACGSRGIVKFNLGKYVEVIQDLDIAIEQEQNNCIYHMMRGITHFQLKQKAKAKADLENVICLNPDAMILSDAKNLLTRLG